MNFLLNSSLYTNLYFSSNNFLKSKIYNNLYIFSLTLLLFNGTLIYIVRKIKEIPQKFFDALLIDFQIIFYILYHFFSQYFSLIV